MMVSADPTTAYRLTTATVPEWAEAATVGVPKMLAEIERLRAENKDLDCAIGHITDIERKGHADIASLKAELADVKTECCRLVCRNGDLEAENERLRGAALSVTRSGVVDGGKVVVAAYWFDRLVQALAKEPQ